MPYLGRQGQFGIRDRFQYLASAGDTSVSGADANGITMTFSDGLYIDVFLNGVKLKDGEDYNTNTANTVAGISAMDANDEIEVISYDAFTVADTVSAADGGTFSGTVSFSGDANVGDDLSLNSDSAVLNFGADSDVTLTHVHNTGLTLETATDSSTNLLQLLSDDAGSGAGPYLRLKRTSGSPADNDNGGIIVVDMENDNNQQFDAVQIMGKATDVSDGTEDSELQIATMVNGTLTTGLTVTGGGITLPEGAMTNSVLQIVKNSSTVAAQNTSSTSYGDMTNANAAITPQSSSNKVLVLWSDLGFQQLVSSANLNYYQQLVRGTTALASKYISAQSGAGGLQMRGMISFAYLDSPNTTSSTTYKIQHKVDNASSSSSGGGTDPHLILIEIGVAS